MQGVDVLPVVLPVLAGLLLRRLGAVLASLGLAARVLWLATNGHGPDDLGLAVAFGAVGGLLLGSAGAMLRPRRIRRRKRLERHPDGGSTW